eukprot:Nk52_evm3s1763 gene=Nk52_evmTU3s1763
MSAPSGNSAVSMIYGASKHGVARLTMRSLLMYCVVLYAVLVTIFLLYQGGGGVGCASYSIQPQACDCSRLLSPRTPKTKLSQSGMTKSEYNGIYPIMRDWGCGHANLEVPRVLQRDKDMPGRREGTLYSKRRRPRFVIDIGLSFDAEETLAAYDNGFIVFGYEPDPRNIEKIRKLFEKRGVAFYEVPIVPGKLPNLDLFPFPDQLLDVDPPQADAGFVFLFAAAAGATLSRGVMGHEQGENGYLGSVHEAKSVNDPALASSSFAVIPPADALPEWVDEIYFVKIDTQGHELGIIKGLLNRLHHMRYIQFEFSPRLMSEKKNAPEVMELLRLLPDNRFLCFDMMGEHNLLPRPSSPLSSYYDGLYAWNGRDAAHPSDGIGPWDDIMCANMALIASSN